MKNNEIVQDTVFEMASSDLSKIEKTEIGLKSLSYSFDIEKPLWLSDNDNDFAIINVTRFRNHHFIESIDFDYLEVEIIEDK